MTNVWPAGTRVFVQRIKQEGIVVEALSGDRYKVAFGSVHTICKGKELRVSSKKLVESTEESRAYHRTLARNRMEPLSDEIDLHGHTVDEALRAVDSYVDRAVIAEKREIRIVHGLGSGKLQEAIHGYLAGCGAVRHYKISEWNRGVTVVYL